MSKKHWIQGAGALLLLTVIAYWPVILRGGWIWDDDSYVTGNPTVKTAEGLGQIWANTASAYNRQYYPLVHSSFWVEYHLWGLWPLPYHVDNVILQAVNAVLVWMILRKLAVPGAWVIAAIFAVHPVHVESVAWVTERKNVLSGMFYLLAMLAYLRFAGVGETDREIERLPPASRGLYGRWGFYALSLLLFVCALFSKSVTCSLPVILGLLLWWKKGKLSWRDMWALAPYLVVGLVLAWNTVRMERTSVGAGGVGWEFSPIDRCLIAGRALWFYAGKLVWPTPLIFIYERWDISDKIWWQYIFPMAWAAVLAGAWIARKRIGRGPVAALLYFSITLFPALGFVNTYPMRFSFVADHFQYLGSLGVIALVTGCVVKFVQPRPQLHRLAAVSAIGLVAALLFRCWGQGAAYGDLEMLWKDTIQKNDTAVIAYENLGEMYIEQGHYEEALPLLLRGKELGKELRPRWVEAYSNLGLLYATTGHNDLAMKEYEEGLQVHPFYDVPESLLYTAYGVGLWQEGKKEEARAALQRGMELDTSNAIAPSDIGLIYYSQGNFQQAEMYFNRAIGISSASVPPHVGMGHLCMAQGRYVEAQQHFTLAALVEPQVMEHVRNVGLALAHQQQIGPAMTVMAQALEMRGKDDPQTLLAQAWVCSLAGQFDDAVKFVQRGIDGAKAGKNERLNQELSRSLAAYQAHQTYEPANLDGAPPMSTAAMIRR